MAKFKFLSTSRIKAEEMLDDTRTYLSRVYGNVSEKFTPASPFAQLLSVMKEITQMIFFYIEDSVVEQNILTAQNPDSIYGLSRLAGHDPFRGSSAVGEISIRLNTSASSKTTGDGINIPPNAVIVSNNNGLKYTLKTNNDSFRLDKGNSNYLYIPIIQGEIEKQTVTGTGEDFQSFNIITKSQTDHGSVNVSVNSVPWQKFDSLYDMKNGTKGFIVKTGITGGLDIYFGNDSFGSKPPAGSSIEVEYIKTKGSAGNLIGSADLTFKFETEGGDSMGNIHNLNELLESAFTSTPKMGADPEDIAFTKLIAPIQSHSFVLATPENYEAFLSKYGMFSVLDAYNTTDDGFIDDDNIIYLFMLPDTKRKLTNDKDYFNLNETEFFFNEDEKSGVLDLIEKSGRQMVTTEVKIVDPSVQKFRMDIRVRQFEGFSKSTIYSNIRSAVSNYLINITRRDRLPKSDIIALIENVEGVDSVSVRFISEKEETARRLGYYISKTTIVTPSTPTLEEIGNGKQKFVFFKKTVVEKQVKFSKGDPLPEHVINLDSFGDILLEKEEVALFRGGWKDREGVVVLDDVAQGEMAALSIYFTDESASNRIYSKMQTQNRKAL